jgi:hypothetical protein
MGIILGFLPFIAFLALAGRLGSTLALSIAAAIALGLVVRSRLRPPHTFKILEVGTAVLMVAMAIYSAVAGAALSLVGLRLCVDGGLLLIVLMSLAVRQPFTLQYAREQVDKAYWNSPRFLRTNYLITSGWAVAFAVMVAAEGLMAADPGFPQPIGFGVGIAALLAAIAFTAWTAKRARTTPAAA